MSEDVARMVKQMIADQFERKIEEITDDALFSEDLGLDSLSQTELILSLEEKFNIVIDDETAHIITVGDAIKYIQERL